MREISKQLLAWLSRLLPKQEVTGNSNVQVGRIEGNLTVVNQMTTPPQERDVEAPPATVSSVLHLLEQLDGYDKRPVVLNFMQNHFGTRWVKSLEPQDLQRTQSFAQGVLRKVSAVAQAAQAGQSIKSSNASRTIRRKTK